MTSFPSNKQFNQFITKIQNALDDKSLEGFETLFSSFKKFEQYYFSKENNNKQYGKYLTENPITQFLIKRALVCYIKEKFSKHEPNVLQVHRFEELFDLKLELQKVICERILTLRVLDPACGTGTFLLNYIKIVYQLIKSTQSVNKWNKAMLSCIQNMYGLDINENAIFLSLLNFLKCATSLEGFNIKRVIRILESNLKVANSVEDDTVVNKFDLIIGNPPYGNILSTKQKQVLKRENIYFSDIYCLFLLKALEWSNGLIGFIVPKSFLLRQSYIRFRDLLLSKANLIEIIDIGSNVFPQATNEVQILIYEPNKKPVKDLDVFQFPHRKVISYEKQNYDKLRICFNKNCEYNQKSKKVFVYTKQSTCPFCNEATFNMNRIRIKVDIGSLALVNKIESQGNMNYLNIKNFPDFIRGEEDRGLKAVKGELSKKIGGNCCFLDAKKHLSYYNYKRKRMFNLNAIDPDILKGLNYEFYTEPKLLIKHNNIFPETVYTEDKVCFTSSIYSLIRKDPIELKFLCSLINSSLIQYYCVYAINNQMNTTINLNQYMIRHLPIVELEPTSKIKIANEVDILSNNLRENSGAVNDIVVKSYKMMDRIYFKSYNISNEEKKKIIDDLKRRISFTRQIYNKAG